MTSTLLSSKQVADLLGVSVSTVARWTRDGRLTPELELPGLRGARFYQASQVARLVEEARLNPPTKETP